MNNEPQKDDLLSEFENPSMVDNNVNNIEQPSVGAPITNNSSNLNVNNQSVATPIDEPVTSTVQSTVEQQPINQNQPEHLDVEPSISVEQTRKEVDIQDDPNFIKKNLKFILIIFSIILVFIFLLPKIISIFGNNY